MKADQKQLKRAEVILKVRGGRMSAAQAARELGVSRKTYYEWERRGLEGLMEALSDGKGGRPSSPADARIEALKARQEQLLLENELLELRLGIHQAMTQAAPSPPPAAAGPRTAKKKRGSRRSS